MESPSEAAAADSSAACTYSQVVFTDIPHSYPPSTPVTCRYSHTAVYQPNSRDWVGIFKVGWSTTKDYHTFVWAEPCQDVAGQQSVTMQAVFKEYYLPKDEIEFYQFCYVDSSGQVRGASTPFCFKTPEEQSTDSSQEDDFLIITTQVEQSNRQKAELQKELDQMREENESLKSALQKEQEQAAILKGQNEQKERERSQVVRDLDQIKEENGNLKSTLQQQLQEMDNLKEEMLVQATKQLEIQQQKETELRKLSQSLSVDRASSQNETHAQEKYDRAVMKINQQKEEHKELKEKIDIQSEEISKLKTKLREGERELVKTKDSIQILEVDLQSSKKENDRLSAELQRLQGVAHNMDEVRQENQDLYRRLSQQETPQDTAGQDDDLKVLCQTLARQLQDAEGKLESEKEESRNAKRRAEYLESEQEQIKKQLETLCSISDQEQRKSSKYELQLREALEAIAEKESIIEKQEHMMRLEIHEKEELARENEKLVNDLEGLRRVYSDLHSAPPTDSPHMQPDVTSPADDTSLVPVWQQDTPDQSDDLYQPIGIAEQVEEQSLVCCHCQERFPGITQNELELHEQSHRVCPFCTMICDYMEQSIFEDHVYSHEV
ncbi:calcium-binding and coiled-coil domain-containing protein 2 isoform X1 [Seriola aureovittata]|uniref:calcium-binding and coiled-coil domain-containing protein 2 isoform X1 n=1 Tax=Seriola aureovittata TaxID=2871759 RepID=UPI0024BD9D0F|nr:calcium-binding and coiled-coil domain-containing protein 2 isoform X1 [Seriola aureovittata]